MECKVETKQGGVTRVRVGQKIAMGPKSLRLLLTRPYPLTGRIVEIPIETIESIAEIADSHGRIEETSESRFG